MEARGYSPSLISASYTTRRDTIPFPFFCDLDEDLNSKVRLGRKEELSRLPGFDAEYAPDPTCEATFRSAKLRWDNIEQGRTLGKYYERLITLRRENIVPLLAHAEGHSSIHHKDDDPLIRVRWQLGAATLRLTANLSDKAIAATVPVEGRTLFASGNISVGQFGAWTVVWSLESGSRDHNQHG